MSRVIASPVHAVGRREHDQTQYVAVRRGRGIDVGDAQRGVSEPADHENDFSIPRTHCALFVSFQPTSMPTLRSSHP